MKRKISSEAMNLFTFSYASCDRLSVGKHTDCITSQTTSHDNHVLKWITWPDLAILEMEREDDSREQ